MAYGRKKYRSARGKRSGTRKYSRKTRSRFSRKRFTKVSTKQKTVVSATVNARETYVKLPWQRTLAPLTLAATTSISYAFLGNSLVPYPTAYSSPTPTSGDEWSSGVAEYASFYNQYRVLGSSIKIQINCHTASGVTFGFALLPIMAGGHENGSVDDIASRITELNALSYDQISMQPYAKTRTFGIGSGAAAQAFFKMFRKTKQMLACKDLRDNEDTLCRLPDTDGSDGTIITNSSSSWFYYVRIFNLSSSSGQYTMQVKTKHYANLSGRTNWTALPTPVV